MKVKTPLKKYEEIEIEIPILKKENFYLIHPRDTRMTIREWELKFEEKTGINLVNPFFDKKGEEAEQNELGPEKYAVSNKKAIVEGDIAAISHPEVKGVIVIIEKDMQKSWGSSMEIFYTHAVLGKKVFTVIEDDRSFHHPWLNTFSDKIFKTKEELEIFFLEEFKDYEKN